MSNHIAAKFMGLIYSSIPSETFKKKHEDVIEVLRAKFPRYIVPIVNDIRVNLSGEQFDTEKTINKEVHMVDAEGKLGIKIGNQGIFLSVDGYVPFDELLEEFKSATEKIQSTFAITHFSQVHLRNCNLFPEISPNTFKDIRKASASYWGRQSFRTLDNGNFPCSGAATRHDYFSPDFKRKLQILSGVVFKTHSYIPQEHWDIWRLRGEVPIAKEVQLLIDIIGSYHQAPLNEPEKQNVVVEYSWDEIAKQLNSLHDDVNSVYGDITEE